MQPLKDTESWDIVVKPKSTLFQLNLKEVWAYRDLVILMVKRDLTAVYKQTILGPLWMFIQPVFTALIFNFSFGTANISTDGIPQFLFYLIGQTFWTYFADCLNKTSTTFISNASVFGKVYFPRLVMPISVVISNLMKLAIQMGLLTIVYCYHLFSHSELQPHWSLFAAIPLFIALIGGFGLSLGLVLSSVTTKYRDFTFLITFAVQGLMFLSCVVLPASVFTGTKQFIILCNPVAGAMESIKYIITGHGTVSLQIIGINVLITIVFFFASLVMFNRTEKSFMDTV